MSWDNFNWGAYLLWAFAKVIGVAWLYNRLRKPAAKRREP
jgi:hypothetical protein